MSSPLHPEIESAIQHILQTNFDATSSVCLTTLLKVLDNVLKQPHSAKVRTLRLSNPTIQQKIVQPQGLAVLEACGFVVEGDNVTLAISPDPTSRLVEARRRLQAILQDDLHVQDVPPMPAVNTNVFTTDTASFNVYQGQRYDGQSAAVGTSLGAPPGWKSQTQQQLERLQSKAEQLEQKIAKVQDRQWKAYRDGNAAPATATVAVVEDSKADAALVAAHIVQQHAKSSVPQGFTTKAMRDLEHLKKHGKVYPYAYLVLKFADGSAVSGQFACKERIGDVLQALKEEVLTAGMDTAKLELFTTPPRTALDPQKTLQELQLVPAAKVFVGGISVAGQDNSKGWFVQPHLFVGAGQVTLALPKGVKVVDANDDKMDTATSEEGKNDKAAPSTTKRKLTKEEKEAALLKKMMGGK